MSQPEQFPTNWAFYTLGAFFILLGIAFFILPLIARSGLFVNLKIPWIILYIYDKNGVYFVTSPLLILLSAASFIIYALRR